MRGQLTLLVNRRTTLSVRRRRITAVHGIVTVRRHLFDTVGRRISPLLNMTGTTGGLTTGCVCNWRQLRTYPWSIAVGRRRLRGRVGGAGRPTLDRTSLPRRRSCPLFLRLALILLVLLPRLPLFANLFEFC